MKNPTIGSITKYLTTELPAIASKDSIPNSLPATKVDINHLVFSLVCFVVFVLFCSVLFFFFLSSKKYRNSWNVMQVPWQ
jgi:hypothetical protein